MPHESKVAVVTGDSIRPAVREFLQRSLEKTEGPEQWRLFNKLMLDQFSRHAWQKGDSKTVATSILKAVEELPSSAQDEILSLLGRLGYIARYVHQKLIEDLEDPDIIPIRKAD